MVGPSHAVCALGVVVGVAHCTGITPSRVELLFYLLGTLAPDIDGDGSIARPGTILKTFVGWRLAKILDALGATVSALANAVCGHRGFFHWPAVAFAIMLTGYLSGLGALLWFGFGYLVHILCDTLTTQGIPVLAPLRFRRFSLSMFRTGSLRELVLTVCVMLGTVYWGFGLLPERLQNGFQEIYLHYSDRDEKK